MAAKKNSKNYLSILNPKVLVLLIVVTSVGLLGAYQMNSSKAATACVYQNFGYGSSGGCVGTIQLMLNYLAQHGTWGTSAYPLLTVDSSYGSKTKTRETEFEKQVDWVTHSNTLSVDGIVQAYPKEWYYLCNSTYWSSQQPIGRDDKVVYAAKAAGCDQIVK